MFVTQNHLNFKINRQKMVARETEKIMRYNAGYRMTCNQCNIIRSTEKHFQNVSNKIMSSTFNNDDDDDIKKGGCGEISQIVNVLIEHKCMCLRDCVSLSLSMRLCVFLRFLLLLLFSFDSYFAIYPFNSIVQWCSFQIHNTHIYIRFRDVHPY